MASPAEIVKFWIDDTEEKLWYIVSEDLDAKIIAQFQADWELAMEGQLRDWWETAEGSLAFIILTDQFSRNMFRGDGRSFASDAIARDCARHAIAWGQDLETPKPARQFFYTPLIHSENLADQAWNIELSKARLAEDPNEVMVHALAHQMQIQKFGRFPARNAALGRDSTPQEQEFLNNGGYGKLVESLQSS